MLVAAALAVSIAAPRAEAKPKALYVVDIHAPRALRKLLEAHLDLARFADRQDLTDDEYEFLVTAAPRQVADLLETQGYFTPAVTTDERVIEGKRHVDINVEPGPITVVTTVNLGFAGPMLTEAPARAKATRDAWSLHEGDPFSQEAWDAAKDTALKTLQAERYLGAKITHSEARINPATHKASLQVNFESGPTFTLGALSIDGTRRYPDWIITNINPLNVGEIYSAERVQELQKQLQATPYFASVALDVDSDTAHPDDTPVRLKVSEYPYQSVRTGVGYSSDTGAYIQGNYQYFNLFDRAWVFSVTGRIERDQDQGQVQISMPPGRYGWVNSALAAYTRSDIQDTEIFSMRAGIQRARTSQYYDFTYSLLYYRDRLLQNVGSSVTSSALVPNWTWTRRDVDDLVFPRSGNIVTISAGVGVKQLASDATFGRLYAAGREYVAIGKTDLVLLRLELGAVFTSASTLDVPASLLYRAGGANSVRGYSYDALGNNVGGSILPTKYMITGTSEYQHWFTRDWGAAVFYDVGTATDTWYEKTIYSGVGTGARWRSPVGPVNLDIAYGIQNHSWRPYLTLGIAF
ncbi:autotransporter assembly complex protein TamA [Pararobbsia silviterrae]|uniref:Outer membrane protein assembly factor n=1 Tax=Pararobbsia silviterrae TaxID=1792498 RepID=A0A494Y314_9BURK|nr:autotransporter assembly complex family protein [Pararobbsia silviterrae]RKP56689.1 outer membrane protein assembly factor [Pararobbsia silviterrae]